MDGFALASTFGWQLHWRAAGVQDMLVDANPMVVANAIASLQEIQEMSGRAVLAINSNTLFKLLAALNECTEWGQVFILDALAGYDCRDMGEAEKIVERVLPRLQHVNSAVVLSAVKVGGASSVMSAMIAGFLLHGPPLMCFSAQQQRADNIRQRALCPAVTNVRSLAFLLRERRRALV